MNTRDISYMLGKLRRGKPWTQPQLAEAAAVSIRTVQRAERGSPVGPETVLALAGALGVDATQLTAVRRVRELPSFHFCGCETDSRVYELGIGFGFGGESYSFCGPCLESRAADKFWAAICNDAEYVYPMRLAEDD